MNSLKTNKQKAPTVTGKIRTPEGSGAKEKRGTLRDESAGGYPRLDLVEKDGEWGGVLVTRDATGGRL